MNKAKGSIAFLVKMSICRICLVLAVLLLSLTSILAQNFPVDLNLQVLPPQSPAFHTYSQSQAIQTNKVLLIANLKDLVVPNLDIGLSFEFRGPNGTFSTDPNLINLPFTIQQGVPLMLNNDDLSSHFLSPELSQNITDANGFMAEGEWEICVTAYELLNQEQVSRQTCFYMFLENYDPPEIIQPFDSILPSFPQNIQLAWQPLHIGAFPVRYNIEIWEALDGFADQQIVDLTPPFYFKTVDQITSSFLTAVDLPLQVGTNYLMRVQAQDNVNGLMGLPVYVFKNQGYSNLHRFKYGMLLDGQECLDPGIPSYTVDDNLDMYVYWNDGEPPVYNFEETNTSSEATLPSTQMSSQQGLTSMSGNNPSSGGSFGGNSSSSNSNTQPIFSNYYKMNYRDVTDGVEGEWSVIETQNEWVLFEDYTRGREYEIFISVICSAEERQSESIFVKFATLPPERDFSCGMPALEIDLSKQTPLASLFEEDTIIAGDMRVVILDVEGSNGYFSGSGYMKPPVFGTKIGLTFNNIFVNNEYRMVDGEMKTMYDPTGSNILDVSAWKDFFPGNDEPFPVIEMNQVTSATFLDGKVTIYPGGETYEAPIRVQTPEGDVILSGGMVIREVDIDLPDRVDSDYKGAFSLTDIHRYGFDVVDTKLKGSYDEFAGISLDNKSIARGGSDFLKFSLTQVPTTWTSASIDSVRIISEENFEFEYERINDKEIRIKMPGLEDVEQVYVIKGNQCLGAFNLIPYTKTLYKVNLIPVNGAGLNITASEIEQQVNSVLKQGVVSVEINLLSDQGVIDNQGVIEADTDVLDAYSDHMKTILESHRQQYGQEENEMYLFVVDKIAGNVVGAMPEGMNAGFIEYNSNETLLSQTIAHELGHGAFTLDHFWMKTDYNKGGSDNLMDYSDGSELVKKQWNRMHQQKFPLPWFKGAEEQQSIILSTTDLFKEYITSGHLTFLSNVGLPVTIPVKNIAKLIFATGGEYYANSKKPIPIGTLVSFDWAEGDSITRYVNYSSGNYYESGKQGTDFQFYYKFDDTSNNQTTPLIIRTTYENQKHAAHIVEIKDLSSITVKTNQAFDFLLPHFYNLEGDISYKGELKFLDEVEGVNLGKSYQSDLYNSIILNYSEFASPNTVSSFYINGLAFFLDRNKQHFNSCGFDNLEVTLQKLLAELEKRYKTETIRIESATSEVTDFTKDLCNLLGYWAEYSETENEAIEGLRDIFSILDPTKAIKEFQASIDACELSYYNETSSQGLKDKFKEIFRSLPQCEFDELKIPYAAIRILLETFLEDGEFYVGNKEERLIVSLIAQIKQEDADNFLTYLNEEREYKVSKYNTGTISPYITTSSEKKRLWTVLVDRVDNFMGPENGKLLMEEVMRVWAIAPSTLESAKLSFANLETNISSILDGGNLNLNFLLLERVTSQIIPYSYHSFFERLKNLTYINTIPYQFIGLPITDVSIDEEKNAINVSNKAKILFFVNENFDVVDYESFGPFDPVIVDKSSQFGSIEEALPASNFSVYPGIIFYYLEKNAASRTSEDVIITSIDMATLAIPATKVGMLGKLLVYADKGSSLASLGGTYLRDFGEFSQEAKILNLTSAVLGFTSLAATGITALAKIEDTRQAKRELFRYLNGAEAQNLGDIPSTTSKFDDLLATISASGDKAIRNLTDDHKQLLVTLIEERKGILIAANELNDLVKFTNAISKLKGLLPGVEGLISELGSINGNLFKAILGPSHNFEKLSGKDFYDLVIHSNGNEFIINGEKFLPVQLANAIPGDEPIRLLSCNSIEVAQDFAIQSNREVIANGGLTRIHIDGELSVGLREGNLDNSWYRFFPDGRPKELIDNMGVGNPKYADDFAEFGETARVTGLSSKCTPVMLSRFEGIGFSIDDAKSIFNTFEDKITTIEKLLSNLESQKDLENFSSFIADLKKSEGLDLLLHLGKIEGEEVGSIVNSWRVVKRTNLGVNPKTGIEYALDPNFLENFSEITSKNYLGFTSKKLEDLLNLPSTKIDAATGLPQKWDDPSAVLESIERAHNAGLNNMIVTHKKFPAPKDGSEPFVLRNAKKYQSEASGDAGLSFEIGGVSFDNISDIGKHVDRKYGHSAVFNADGSVKNQTRANSILDQAERQLNAVGGDGSKLLWEISSSGGSKGIERLFLENPRNLPGLEDIDVTHVIQKEVI